MGKLEAYRWLARHRDRAPIHLLHRAAGAIDRACENDSFDAETNGERRVLERLGPLGLDCVFDVGANVGNWTADALAHSAARVHAFEIEPVVRDQLVARFVDDRRVTVAPTGLAATPGIVDVAHDSRSTTASTTSTVLTDLVPQIDVIQCPVTTGDAYAASHGIDAIDFVKVDVEGADLGVLRGFRRMLEAGQVRTLQFEFTLWAPIARVWLADFYELLEPAGFTIGKIYPTRVDWRAYTPRDERFLRANFLATIDDAVVATLGSRPTRGDAAP